MPRNEINRPTPFIRQQAAEDAHYPPLNPISGGLSTSRHTWSQLLQALKFLFIITLVPAPTRRRDSRLHGSRLGGAPGVHLALPSAWFLLSFLPQCNTGAQNLYFGRGTSLTVIPSKSTKIFHHHCIEQTL